MGKGSNTAASAATGDLGLSAQAGGMGPIAPFSMDPRRHFIKAGSVTRFLDWATEYLAASYCCWGVPAKEGGAHSIDGRRVQHGLLDRCVEVDFRPIGAC